VYGLRASLIKGVVSVRTTFTVVASLLYILGATVISNELCGLRSRKVLIHARDTLVCTLRACQMPKLGWYPQLH
jgi:hypothetical protein